MLTESVVELHAWLHSYLCFSLLEKRFLSYVDTSSTPGYLLSFQTFSYNNFDRSSTARWIDQESSWTFDSFSIASGSIKILFLYLCFVPQYLLDSCICRCCFSWHLPQQMARHLYLLRITEALYIGLSRSNYYFLDLSWSIHSYSPPKHFLLPLNLQPMWFSAFPCFKSLGMFFFFFFSCI